MRKVTIIPPAWITVVITIINAPMAIFGNIIPILFYTLNIESF